MGTSSSDSSTSKMSSGLREARVTEMRAASSGGVSFGTAKQRVVASTASNKAVKITMVFRANARKSGRSSEIDSSSE